MPSKYIKAAVFELILVILRTVYRTPSFGEVFDTNGLNENKTKQ